MKKSEMELECKKIPSICQYIRCLFEIEGTECNSKVRYDWLMDKRLECPKICPKYREKTQ